MLSTIEKFISQRANLADANLQLFVSANIDAAKMQQLHQRLQAGDLQLVDGVAVAGGYTLSVVGLAADVSMLNQSYRALSDMLDIDIAWVKHQPSTNLKQKGVLFMDMDSTLIQCECIDEIADFLGIKDKISQITQSAMEGKLDFSESLLARVKLLAGLDVSVLQQVYEQRIRLTQGAEHLIQTVHQYGWKVGLVSGGFTYFTGLLEARLQLDFTAANTLEIVDGKLTGRILGEIVDAPKKRALLLEKCKVWDVDIANTVALGDGANDLPMLGVAGLGIAFHAKPQVRQAAPFALSHGGLDHTLHLLSDWQSKKV